MKKKDVEEVMQEMINSYNSSIIRFSPNHPFRKNLESKKECYEICLALVQAIEGE
jgi:hypothetical protein